MIDPGELARAFEATFGQAPRLYRAPGRVNLIGEHTDYNDGFVMPVAIDRSTWVAAFGRRDSKIVVRSREFGETCVIDHSDTSRAERRPSSVNWIDYVRGVAIVLDRDCGKESGTLPGADLMIASDVPIGAGLSSSAALEIACGYALAHLANWRIDLTALARAGQRAEHEFVGTRCGIMDQMIACHARAGYVLLLDTRTLERRYLPLPGEVCALICNTMVGHQLASAEYNARRADCETGVRILARHRPGIRALRDVSARELESARDQLTDRVFRRCRHVITENRRVEEAGQGLLSCDFAAFGRLMNDSHESLRSDYEVSCRELDVMAAIARRQEGVYGARMTGAGFGGCVVALVDANRAAHVEQRVVEGYEAATGLRPDVWISSAGPGVSVVSAP